MSDSETTGSSDISEYGGYSDDEETATYATSKTAVREERRQHVAQKWHERIKQHYRHRKFIEPQRAEAGEQQGSDDQPSDLVQAVLALPGALVGAIPFGEDGRTAKVAPSGEPEVADDGEVELVTAQDVQAAMKRGLEDKGGAPVFSRRYIVYETKFVGPDFGVESKQERLRRESEAAPETSLLETLGGLASSVASAVGAAPEEEEEEVQPTPIPTLVPPRRPPVPLNRHVTVASSLFGKGLEAEMPKQKPKNDRLCARAFAVAPASCLLFHYHILYPLAQHVALPVLRQDAAGLVLHGDHGGAGARPAPPTLSSGAALPPGRTRQGAPARSAGQARRGPIHSYLGWRRGRDPSGPRR